MRAPTINPGGSNPSRDGDINLYSAPEGAGQSWFDTTRRVIFVNGMDNSPEDHARSARALSLLQACPVIGVYNQTNGVARDLVQCITDKATMMGVTASPLSMTAPIDAIVGGIESLYQLVRSRRPGLDRIDFMGTLIDGNPAALALYALLVTSTAGQRQSRPIFSHSQGNLITSNALTALSMALGPSSLSGIEVNSFGSPCRYWPPGIRRTNNAFTFDPVSWLDLTTDLTSSKVGFRVAHGFDVYMANDGEFVVNRFRWGSFGMTASMDEVGLAQYCVRIGNNPRRLRGIFERLRDAHWTDSDDVAYEYVTRLPDATLRALKSSDPGFIQLLVDLLEAGWTSGAEREAINRLQAA